MNYKDAYYYLFNQITDFENQLKNIQIKAEDICISSADDELSCCKRDNDTH